MLVLHSLHCFTFHVVSSMAHNSKLETAQTRNLDLRSHTEYTPGLLDGLEIRRGEVSRRPLRDDRQTLHREMHCPVDLGLL